MIFSIFWFPELFHQVLHAFRRRSEKGQASKVTHLFATVLLKPVRQVDIMIEEGGLCDGCGYDWDLQVSALSEHESRIV